MKFSCDRENLLKNLHISQRATDPRSNVAVLRNVLFELSGDKLSMVGYDHRIGIKTGMACSVESEGRITVPCALLLDVLGVMQESTAYFSLDDSVLHMECGKSRYNFNCLPADDFPPFPKSEGKESLEIGPAVLEQGIRQTIFSTNADDPRAFMGGVLLNMDKEKSEIKFVATDGHRLAVRKFKIEGQTVPNYQVIVPSRTMNEVLRVLSDAGDKPVKISIDQKSISFAVDDKYIVSRLVEAEYPKYEKVVPTRSEGSCRINRLRMMGSVRGASIMARSKENKDLIEINVTDESIRFSSSTQDVGSANEELEIAKKGRDIRVAFNSKYILDFLNAVEDDEVVFEYIGELDPGLFHSDMPDYKYVLMPIKV
jgi:DNA polymerase III subunit beta